jgi:hypothetical protein
MTDVVHDINGKWCAAGYDDPVKAMKKFQNEMKWWARKVRFQIWFRKAFTMRILNTIKTFKEIWNGGV